MVKSRRKLQALANPVNVHQRNMLLETDNAINLLKIAISKTYIWFCCRQQMDFLYNPTNTSNRANDLPHDIRHLIHKPLGMDPGIYCSHKTWSSSSHYYSHIRGDIQSKDRRNIRADNCMSRHYFFLCKRHSHRMVMDCMVRVFLVHVVL